MSRLAACNPFAWQTGADAAIRVDQGRPRVCRSAAAGGDLPRSRPGCATTAVAVVAVVAVVVVVVVDLPLGCVGDCDGVVILLTDRHSLLFRRELRLLLWRQRTPICREWAHKGGGAIRVLRIFRRTSLPLHLCSTHCLRVAGGLFVSAGKRLFLPHDL